MWFDGQYLSSLISLVTAALLGGIIGFERAGKNHDAGLRTHMLVCLGSATVMVLSKYLVLEYQNLDIMRLGAQVISGIGFLGVGCIIVTGDRVKGLTTAAGLWTTACTGLVVGMGYYLIAGTVVLLMLVAVLGLRPIALRFQGKSLDLPVSVTVRDRKAVGDVLIVLKESGVEITALRVNELNADGEVQIKAAGHCKNGIDTQLLTGKLLSLKDVKSISL